ncbi:hypothetical protein T4D_49 [Trichinella pseudospiralis]|uniref:Uncharacterized protein n=1 Tax=Trichinella pseudospiralis TaxID=6337 RepID=A0A0V1F562_TRIPS|nr:hypothetical protein T4D_49 [Trichinella pseudospiralis]
MPSSISSHSVGRYRRSRSRTGSRTRRQRRPRSRSRSLRRSPRQSLSPSSRLGLQRKTSVVALDGDDTSAEIICPSCLQSLQSRSRSRSITKRKSLGKKVAGKAAAKSTSKSGRKPSRSKKKSVKKSNRKAVSIRSTKSRRKRSSLKLTTRKKRKQQSAFSDSVSVMELALLLRMFRNCLRIRNRCRSGNTRQTTYGIELP